MPASHYYQPVDPGWGNVGGAIGRAFESIGGAYAQKRQQKKADDRYNQERTERDLHRRQELGVRGLTEAPVETFYGGPERPAGNVFENAFVKPQTPQETVFGQAPKLGNPDLMNPANPIKSVGETFAQPRPGAPAFGGVGEFAGDQRSKIAAALAPREIHSTELPNQPMGGGLFYTPSMDLGATEAENARVERSSEIERAGLERAVEEQRRLAELAMRSGVDPVGQSAEELQSAIARSVRIDNDQRNAPVRQYELAERRRQNHTQALNAVLQNTSGGSVRHAAGTDTFGPKTMPMEHARVAAHAAAQQFNVDPSDLLRDLVSMGIVEQPSRQQSNAPEQIARRVYTDMLDDDMIRGSMTRGDVEELEQAAEMFARKYATDPETLAAVGQILGQMLGQSSTPSDTIRR